MPSRRALTSGSSGEAKGRLSIATMDRASPFTATPSHEKRGELVADGQCRGGEYPGTGPRLHVFPQPFRNLEGCVLQEQTVGVGVDPAQPRVVRQLAQGGKRIRQGSAAPRAGRDACPRAETLELGANVAEGGLELRQHIEK